MEWALQLDDRSIRFDWLKQRKTDRELKQQQRTQKAREVRAKKGVGLLNNPTRLKSPLLDRKLRGVGLLNRPRVGLLNNLHKTTETQKRK